MDGPPLTATEFSSAVTAITGAFGDPTRRDIYLHVRERGDEDTGVTAADAAAAFDLPPNVARHPLDKLAAGGYLEIAVERLEGASAGRPSKHYRVADAGSPIELPVRQDAVLVSLLGRALALLPSDQAEEMAEEVGAEVGRSMVATLRHLRFRTWDFPVSRHAKIIILIGRVVQNDTKSSKKNRG